MPAWCSADRSASADPVCAPCPARFPDQGKKRRLDTKEKRIYAPMSNMGDLVRCSMHSLYVMHHVMHVMHCVMHVMHYVCTM